MYKLTNSTSIIRLSDNAFIPADHANTDYAAYLKWVEEGNTADPADPADPLPPQPAKQFTSLEFLDLFTEEEHLAIVVASSQSAPVKLWYDRMLAASFITLDDPRTEVGLEALVSASLLTAERKTVILAAMQ